MASALKDSVGLWGEEYASRFLVKQGLIILGRNLRTLHAEVDILLADGETLIVCEVKTRTSTRAGIAGESIDTHRIDRLLKTTELLLSQFVDFSSARVDAVLIDVSDTNIQLQHVRGLQ